MKRGSDEPDDEPCFVVAPNGVYLRDSWCYGPSRYLGRAAGWDQERELIKAAIRRAPDYNGAPVFLLSDHGNYCRVRAIRLRRLGEAK